LNSGRGGKRPGAGQKKGAKWPSTIAKEEARELTRRLITEHLEPIIGAHITNAQGTKYLVTRNAKTGKFERVSQERMEQLLESGDKELETIEVYDKDPSVEAFKTLLDRALDKPKEQAQEVNLTINSRADRVAAARLRADGKRK
jgi:hypothetical protein